MIMEAFAREGGWMNAMKKGCLGWPWKVRRGFTEEVADEMRPLKEERVC